MPTIVPLIIPLPSSSIHSDVGTVFIPVDEDDYFNLGFIREFDIYKSQGEWWIRFCIANGSVRYIYPGFKNREEAQLALKNIFNQIPSEIRKK